MENAAKKNPDDLQQLIMKYACNNSSLLECYKEGSLWL